MQENKPISFASRSLTESEKQYAQIEKEFLAITYAVEKFKNYIYGRKVKVSTDHKPLIGLMKKKVSDIISPRLQQMRLKLIRYDLELQYIPGKYMYVADLLSRDFIKDKVDDDPEMAEVIHSVKAIINITDEMKGKFQTETEKDETLGGVKVYCEKGWPKVGIKENKELVEYSNIRGRGQEVHW